MRHRRVILIVRKISRIIIDKPSLLSFLKKVYNKKREETYRFPLFFFSIFSQITLFIFLFMPLILRFTVPSAISSAKDISIMLFPFTRKSKTALSSAVKLHILRKYSHSVSTNSVFRFITIAPFGYKEEDDSRLQGDNYFFGVIGAFKVSVHFSKQ